MTHSDLVTWLRVLVVFVTSLAGQARAQTLDRVVLRDGTVLQGVVSQARPDGSIELVGPGGNTRTIAAADIYQADGPAFGDPLLHPWPGRQPVAFEATDGRETRIMATEGSGRSLTARQLCRAPCTLFAPEGGLNLRLDNSHGEGSYIHLDVPRGGVAAGVKAPARGLQLAFVGIGGGVALSMAGVMTLIFAQGYTDKAGNIHDPVLGQQIGGGVLIGLGAVTLTAIIIATITGHGGIKYLRPLAVAK